MPKRHVEKSDGVASELNLDETSLRFDIEHIEINVGKRLRTLRGERGLSIRGLAGKSGLAVNTLSLIENGKTSPSVSTLQQLAEALKVPITAFFKPDMEQKFVVHTPLAERPHTEIEKALLQDLGAGLATRAVQPLVVTLQKGGGSGAMPIVHTGYEFVYCLNGRILYTIDGQPYLLNPGDSLLFESHLPHRWENVDMEDSQILLVLYPTDLRDRVTDRHFGLA
jgi:transcriptional regulator with XRE-family HTH domain